jgi:CheY-like chemotaxis protein
VAVSGFGRDEDRQLSREAGIDRHVTKPPDLTLLLELVAGGSRDGED